MQGSAASELHSSGPLLALQSVGKSFGGLVALDAVGFGVATGDVVGLIGPNGSGKTTLFNVISGLIAPDRGSVWFDGQDISHLRSHAIAARGVGRTFQNARLFPSLSLLENLCLPQYVRSPTTVLAALSGLPRARQEQRVVRERAEQLLGDLAGGRLYPRRHDLPHTCSLGEQRMLETMRVLALDPQLVLLDEPMQGLNPTWVADMLVLIEEVRRRGKTILMIEHKMSVVMKVSDRVVVLNSGRKICEGTPEVVRNDPEVLHAYLGQQ